MLKFSENPPALLPRAKRLTDLNGQWWVAHTKPRCEKAFAFDLMARDIGYFLPMADRTIVSGGRKRRTLIPLFTSYVFFCGTLEDRCAALRTGRLVMTIDVVDQEQLIDELAALDQVIAAGGRFDPTPLIEYGHKYRVTSGPFCGIEGIVVRRADGARIVLEVTMLGQGAAMEINADLLEPVSDTSLTPA